MTGLQKGVARRLQAVVGQPITADAPQGPQSRRWNGADGFKPFQLSIAERT